MKISRLPPSVIDRLVVLDQHATVLTQRAWLAESGVSEARDVINNKTEADARTIARVHAGFNATLKASQEARKRADAAQRTASSVKAYIDMLPADAEVALAEEPRANGLDLDGARSKIAAIRAEIKKLKDAPMPSPDIEQRVENYVDALARKPVMVQGLRAGENLDFLFPMAPDASVRGGYAPLTANPLMLAARFHREALIADLLMAIETEVATPLPPSERPARIAALEQQLTSLQNLETVFVRAKIEAGATDITFDPQVLPAVLLGISVTERETKLAS